MERDIVLRVALAVLLGCDAPPGAGPDAAVGPDAGPEQIATGRHLVARPAVLGGVTSDGFVAFSDFDASDRSVARVIPISGGDEVVLATTIGTGKPDIRFETPGPLVFAWTDRENRRATLTLWSAITGGVEKGPDIRPGRAAATDDGAFVIYQRDVTDETASVVAGPVAGPAVLVASANSDDSTCWRDTDLAIAGDRFIARFCPASATAFTLRSSAPDGSASTDLTDSAETASYGAGQVVWRETDGTLKVAAPDGTLARTLATDVADFVVSLDETQVAWMTTAGAILAARVDGSAEPRTMVAEPIARMLGPLSPDNQVVLFASQIDDREDHVQPYTDVLAGRAGQPPLVLVPDPTSCPRCLRSSFTADGELALVIDPIDNSQVADAPARSTHSPSPMGRAWPASGGTTPMALSRSAKRTSWSSTPSATRPRSRAGGTA